MLEAILLASALLGADPSAKDVDFPMVSLAPDTLKVGQRGRVCWKVDVEEIVDENNMIGTCHETAYLMQSANGRCIIASRGSRFDGHESDHDRKVWIIGYPTKDVPKNGVVDFYRGANVLENHSAKTAGGKEISLASVQLTILSAKQEKGSFKAKSFTGPNSRVK